MKNNILLLTDSYKFSHSVQYPKGTTEIYSYLESRVGGKFKETVFYGLQYFLKEYLQGQVVTREKIDRAKDFVDAHVGPGIFNLAGWEYILEKYQGKLPLEIMAVPEGTVVPIDNVLMTIRNTDPKCFWLTNYMETLLSQIWYTITVATLSRETKKVIAKYLDETGTPELINFKLHDFGFRGVSSVESAGLGASAHLVNFMGTDTVAGITLAQDYYNAGMIGFSIPASEHSTITSWGRENENLAMKNMLDQYPKGLVACVSDSYDIYNACSNIWGEELKAKVLEREGTLVVRPDSGDPIKVVPEVIKSLGDKFGFSRNSKGYLVLNDKVRVIQGDGCNYESIGNILEELKNQGISADNIAFGMGGGLLQSVNRDTQRFAFKCSAAIINGEVVQVSKNPVTDGSKKSKQGRVTLIEKNKEYKTVDIQDLGTGTPFLGWHQALKKVFLNGELLVEDNFDLIRERAKL